MAMVRAAIGWTRDHQRLVKWSGLAVIFWLCGVSYVFGELTPEQTAALATTAISLAAGFAVEALGVAFHLAKQAAPAIKAAMASALATGGVVGAINLVALSVVPAIGVVAIVGLAVVVVLSLNAIADQQLSDGIKQNHSIPAKSGSGEQTDFSPPPTTPDGQLIEAQIQALVDIADDGSLNPHGPFGPRGFTVVGPVFSGGSVDLTDPNNPGSIGGGQTGPTLSQSLNLSPVDPGFFGDPSAPGGLPGIGEPSGPAPDVGLDASGDDGFGCRDGRYVHYATGSVYGHDCHVGHAYYEDDEYDVDVHVYPVSAKVPSLSPSLLVLLGLGGLALRRRFA